MSQCLGRFPRIIFALMISVAGFWMLTDTAFSAEVKDQDGKVYTGDILDQDARFIYIDTPQGVINIEKSRIAAIDGTPYQSAEPQPAAKPKAAQSHQGGNKPSGSIPPPSPEPAGSSDTESPPEEYAIRVGKGGVSKFLLSVYQSGNLSAERHRFLSGMDWGGQNEAVRKAIEDEIVFQEALAGGTHKDPEIKKGIIEEYKAVQSLAGINSPRDFPQSELKAFYEKNKPEFMYPAEFRFKVLNSIQESEYARVKSNPESAKGWQSKGWHKQGDSFYLPFSSAEEEAIYRLRKGQVSDLLSKYQGQGMVFWCVDYKPPVQKTFEESIERVRHLLLKEKQKANTAAFEKNITAGASKPLDSAVFEEAIKNKVHEQRHFRDQIINTYLQKKGTQLGKVVKSAHSKYQVEVLSA